MEKSPNSYAFCYFYGTWDVLGGHTVYVNYWFNLIKLEE